MKKNKTRYLLDLHDGQIYEDGGWLSGGTSMAATGLSLGSSFGPIGMLAGGLGGFALGAITGSAADQEEEKIRKEQERRARNLLIESMPRRVGIANMTPDVMSFQNGGPLDYTGMGIGFMNNPEKWRITEPYTGQGYIGGMAPTPGFKNPLKSITGISKKSFGIRRLLEKEGYIADPIEDWDFINSKQAKNLLNIYNDLKTGKIPKIKSISKEQVEKQLKKLNIDSNEIGGINEIMEDPHAIRNLFTTFITGKSNYEGGGEMPKSKYRVRKIKELPNYNANQRIFDILNEREVVPLSRNKIGRNIDLEKEAFNLFYDTYGRDITKKDLRLMQVGTYINTPKDQLNLRMKKTIEPIIENTVEEFKKGGIYIKPSKRGTFTTAAKKHGKSVQAFASQVLANKDNYSPAMVKKANFARNARKWKHEEGGEVKGKRKVYLPIKNLEYDRSLRLNRGWSSSLNKAKNIDEIYQTEIGTWKGQPLTMSDFLEFPEYVKNYYRPEFVVEYHKNRFGLPNIHNEMNLNTPERYKGDMYTPAVNYKPGNEIAYYKKGGSLTSAKAKEILRDGTVHGKPLTDKQKRFFGWVAGGRKKRKYAEGGDFDEFENMYGNDELMSIEGPSHEEGGIQFTPDAELEGGETVYNNVVNSDSIEITEDIAYKYGLPKEAIGKTVAEYSKTVEKKYEGRDVDPFAMTSKKIELNNIAKMSMDLAENYQQEEEMEYGGKMKYQYSDEEPIKNEKKQIYTDEEGRRYTIDMFGRRNYAPYLMKNIGKIFTGSLGEKKELAPITKNNQSRDIYGLLWETSYNRFGQPVKKLVKENKVSDNIPEWEYNNYGISGNEFISTKPEEQPIQEKPRSTGTASSRVTSPNIGSQNFNKVMPSEEDYLRENIVFNNLDEEGNLRINKAMLPEIMPLARTGIESGQLRPTNLTPVDTSTGLLQRGKMLTEGLDWGNIGQKAMGLAPIAVGAAQMLGTMLDKPERTNLGRLAAQEIHPAFIDPSYQLQEAADVYATGNEAMRQASRKDYLRRRIQSATEEAKTKSGILGQIQSANTQMLNRAREANAQAKMQTDAYNAQMAMREEDINAANLGAWRTARDYQMSNLASMLGERARDIGMGKAQDRYNEVLKETISNMFPGQRLEGYNWINTTPLESSGVSYQNPLTLNKRNNSWMYNIENDPKYYGNNPNLESAVINQRNLPFFRRNTFIKPASLLR